MNRLSTKINILIMPTDICNMNCIYCFHHQHHENCGKMSIETLSKLYEITLNKYKKVNFIWHGGEPLIMGIDFYKQAISMQKKYRDCKIINRIQSNLTLLTDEFIEFFDKEKFGIGSSFDGILNEELRGNSHKILLQRDKIIRKKNTCGFIMVISNKNINTLIESYNFFKSINSNFTINMYIKSKDNSNTELELNVKNAIKRIIELYNLWLYDTECNIHIDYFERILNFIINGKKGVCKYSSCLGKWVGIRYDGSIVPCNRYFPDEYSYGNVYDYSDLNQAFESEGFYKLLSEAIIRREKCKSCIVYPMCNGGCNNVAYNENGISDNGGPSCQILINIFKYIKNSLYNIEDDVKKKCINPKVLSILLDGRRKVIYDSNYNLKKRK